MFEAQKRLWIATAKHELVHRSSMSVDECGSYAKALAKQAEMDYGPNPSKWGRAREYVIEDMRCW